MTSLKGKNVTKYRKHEYEKQDIKSVHIYDFDGTLFLTPDRQEGEKIYFEKTGKSWASTKKKGWWNLAETLDYPFEIRVGPAYEPFLTSVKQKDCLIILVNKKH